MADPVTLAAVAIGGTALGGVTSALGQVFGGFAQSSMYKYQSAIAKINQQIDKQNADYARWTGEVEAQKSGMQTRAQIGATTAIQGASGLNVGGGSATAVRESEASLGRYDQALIRSNAARQAYGFEVKAAEAGVQAKMYSNASKASMISGIIGGMGSLLGTAGSVSSKWLQASTVGIYGAGSGTTDPTMV